MGSGLSISFPTVLTTASRLPGVTPGPAIATVSTFGYAGFLAGPPLIGFVAEAITLRGGLAVVVVTCLVVAFLAGRKSMGSDSFELMNQELNGVRSLSAKG